MTPPYIGDGKIIQYCQTGVKPQYDEAGVSLDWQYPVWPGRAVTDYMAGLPWDVSCAKHIRELRQALGLPVVDPPVRGRQGVVRMNSRSMADDGGLYLALGSSLFWAQRGMVTEPDRARQNVRWLHDRGVDFVRVLMETTDWPDERNRCDPRDPSWDAGLALLRMAKEEGIRVAVTCFGGTQLTSADQQAAIWRIIGVLRSMPEQVQCVEVCNEGIGFDGAIPRMQDFANQLRAIGVPVVLTSVASIPNAYVGMDLSAQWLLGNEHFDRTDGENHWRYVRQPWGYWDSANVPGWFISMEPCGIGSSVHPDDDPARQTMAAVVTWLSGGAAYVVHTGAGIYGVPNTHPAGGKRPANVWEQPTLDPILAGITTQRALLPCDLASWARENAAWPVYPVYHQTPIGDDAIHAGLGCTRAYAMVSGLRWVCAPIGVMQYAQMVPKDISTRAKMFAWDGHELRDDSMLTLISLEPASVILNL